jgi:hypothetical protein
MDNPSTGSERLVSDMSEESTPTVYKQKCSACGQEFEDPRRYEYHIDHGCPAKTSSTTFKVSSDRKVASAKTQPKTEPTTSIKKEEPKKVSSIRSGTPVTTLDGVRLQRKNEWSKYIYKDLNPMLFSGIKSYCAIPEGWEDGIVFEGIHPETNKPIQLWNPSLRQRLTFSEKESEKLADAAARFSISPMGIAVTAWLESNAGLIALGMAAFVAAKFGWKVMQTKAEITQMKEIYAQQQKMMMEGQTMNGVANDHSGANTTAA